MTVCFTVESDEIEKREEREKEREKREERRDRYRKQIETERRNSIDRLDADTQTHRVSLLLIFLAVLGISLVDFPVVLGIPYVPSFLLISLPLPFRVSLIALSLLLS